VPCSVQLLIFLFSSHKYQQLPLIPIEQFLAEHPEKADLDESSLTIARIEHEHKGRLALEEQRQRLLKKKEGLIQANKKRKDDLANLDKDLEKFIDVRFISINTSIKLIWVLRLRSRFRRHCRCWERNRSVFDMPHDPLNRAPFPKHSQRSNC
jgi:Fms-interacting protein/Thoc5